VRQLASRARRHVEQGRPRFQTTRDQREELGRRFFQAAEQGDLAGLEALLGPRCRADRGRRRQGPALAQTLRSRTRVAQTLIEWLSLDSRLPSISFRPTEINGAPGTLIFDNQPRLVGVTALNIADGEIKVHRLDRQPRQAEAPGAGGEPWLGDQVGAVSCVTASADLQGLMK
jgi:hypothetical protein